MSARGKRIRGWVVFLTVLLVVGGAAAGVYHMRKAQASVAFPVAPARKGDFLVLIRARGELKAARSVQVYAPIVPQLRIAWLAASGAMIHQGDLMIKFDSSASEQQLQQKDAALRQAQATLDQAVAQARITAEQDKRDLADAQFNVEKARLEASKQEIVSELQAEESRIDLGLCEQKLKSRRPPPTCTPLPTTPRSAPSPACAITTRTTWTSPSSASPKWRSRPPSPGSELHHELLPGLDERQAFQSGRQRLARQRLAEIPDLDTLEMEGKIEEIDRGRIAVGQEVRVHIDSLPELTMPAESGRSRRSPKPKQRMAAHPQLPSLGPHPASRSAPPPGMNSGMDIVVNRIPNAISIPAKALFTRDGKPVVYVADGGATAPSRWNCWRAIPTKWPFPASPRAPW